jgi:23S rRNA (cytidine1920-2'-O)/16S rRNA (cytidine1409-2'-O)-methyltransferase
MDGAVLINGKKCTKPGALTAESSLIEIIPSWKPAPYVSRGGIKLEHALKFFNLDVSNQVCIDLGASTGGFTHCLLQHGASKVYAVDVGYGQLDWRLRQDKRVIVKERFNARNLTPKILYEKEEQPANLAVIDVSFISITKILQPCLSCLNQPNGKIICLIKPQFEAGKSEVKRGGVIHSAEIHLSVLQSIVSFADSIGLSATQTTYSPLKGPAGNIEFLLLLQASKHPTVTLSELQSTVQDAHSKL